MSSLSMVSLWKEPKENELLSYLLSFHERTFLSSERIKPKYRESLQNFFSLNEPFVLLLKKVHLGFCGRPYGRKVEFQIFSNTLQQKLGSGSIDEQGFSM